MNFRQRVSWLLVALFLLLSCFIVYYIFEISDQYNSFAVLHQNKYDAEVQKDPGSLTVEQSVKTKLFSLPFWGWLLILLIPYLQVFCLLVACTKNDPANATVMVVPCFLCLRLTNWKKVGTSRPTASEAEAAENGKYIANGDST